MDPFGEAIHVFKICYGNTMRRVTCKNLRHVSGTFLSSDTKMFRELLATIRRDFKIPESSELVLSYTDNEKDKVIMVGDDDIRDAFLHQKLNPVRISVVVAQGPDDPLPAGNFISEDITPPWAAEIISKLDQLLNRELVATRTKPSIIENLMTARHVLEEADDFFRVEPAEHVNDPDSEFRRRAMILRQRVMTDERND